MSSYYTIAGSDDYYCEECVTTRPRCTSCGVPLGQSHWRLHDERLQCDKCHATAIYNPTEARAIYDETISDIVKHLDLRLTLPVAFRLVDAPTLWNMRRQGNDQTGGQPFDQETRTLGLYVHNRSGRAIFILHALPRLIFRTTVAHEYAHAWQDEHCPTLEDTTLREGFAEWVAFYHLLWLGATKAARHMLHGSHPYRPAMEQVLQLERQLGRAGVIDYIKRAV